MYNIKKVSVVILIVAVVALVASSFVGEDIIGRAIIIGLGLDPCGEGVRVTAEVLSPSSSGEQAGMFSKTITAEGESVAVAIARITELTGKEASLGRCLVLMFGQDYYEQRDLTDDIEYFIKSDSFKESSSICCVEGSAEDFFGNSASMTQGVSLALSSMFNAQVQQTAISTNTLLDYTLSQTSSIKTGFMNVAKFILTDNQDPAEPDKPQGYFDINNIAIFKNNNYLCKLTDTEIKGFALLNNDVIGSMFVSDKGQNKVTVTVNNKDIKLEVAQDNTIKCNIDLLGKIMRTDSGESKGQIVAQKNKELSPEVIEDIVNQATMQVNALLDKQRQYDFDIVNLHETYRRRNGASEQLDNLSTADIGVQLTVKFTEK